MEEAAKEQEQKLKPKMGSQNLIRTVVFATAMAVLPCSLFAQSPFDGTWLTDLDKSHFVREPMIFSVNKGFYDCVSCAPRIHVKADGNDQQVDTQLATIAVTEVDSHTIKIIGKQDGALVSERILTVSADGRTLKARGTFYYLERSTTPFRQETTWDRIGNSAPAGANLTSGSWKERAVSGPFDGLLVTYTTKGGELTMSAPTGSGWTAKFDGNYYPVTGSYSADSVSLKKINDRTIQVNLKLNGTLVRVNRITISDDGKTLTTVSESELTGTVSQWLASKQE
jgi:hypothetical protein